MKHQAIRTASAALSKVSSAIAGTPIGTAIKHLGIMPASPRDLPYLMAAMLQGETTMTRSFEGYNIMFVVSDATERRSVAEHYSDAGEAAVLRDILAELRADDVFVDIGAYIGLQTCLFGQIVDQAIAYEPHPTNVRRLRQNIAVNDLEVDVFNQAVSDTAGDLEYYISPGEGTETAGRLEDLSESERESITVPVTTLRTAIPDQHSAPTILKIDAEGEELAILNDFAESDAQSACRLIYCEVHPHVLRSRGESGAMVRKRLQAMGYTVTVFRDVHAAAAGYILKAKRDVE